MCQSEGTTLWGQAQRKILEGVFLLASESQTKEWKVKNARGYKTLTQNRNTHSKPEHRFCAGSNPSRGLSEIRDGEDIWQWFRLEIRLEIRLNGLRWSTIPQKHFNWSRVVDDVEKQWNEKPPVKSKTTATTKITKASWRFSQASTITESFVESTSDWKKWLQKSY